MLVKKWVEQVLSKASKVTEKYIEGVSSKNHYFATPATLGSRRSKRLDSGSKKLSKAVTAVYTIGSCAIIYPSADTTKIVPLLHTVITSGNSDSKLENKLPQANVCLKQKAPPLYSQSWLTMAKICLADGNLAKRYIPLFAQVCRFAFADFFCLFIILVISGKENFSFRRLYPLDSSLLYLCSLSPV